MDFPTFVIEFLKAVTWPMATVSMLILLRQPITELLRLTRRFKYQEFEIEFEREISEVSEKVGAARLPQKSRPRFVSIRALALEQPALSIIDAWREVEQSLVEFGKSRKLNAAEPVWVMPLVLSALLFAEDKFTQAQHDSIVRLKALRDRITHVVGFAVSAEEAIKYVDLAERVVAMLQDSEVET
jgi:hypothetical protein